MDIKLSACAEHVIMDANSGRLSIINIYEGIEAASFPLLLANFAFVMVSERQEDEPNEQAFVLKFLLDEDVLKEGPLLIDYEETNINRAIIGLRGLVIPHPGRVYAKVFNENDAEIASWSFSVDQEDVEMHVNNQSE